MFKNSVYPEKKIQEEININNVKKRKLNKISNKKLHLNQ